MSHPGYQRPAYPPQQHGYPPAQGYPPPPPPGYGYAPPPPPPVDRRLERGRKVQRFLRFVVVIGVIGGAVWAGIYYTFLYNGRPEAGDCLSGIEEEFEGWPLVDCDDPSAAWQVVDVDTGGKYESNLHTCDGYPEGKQFHKGGGRRSGSSWEMCVVPYTPGAAPGR